MSALSAVPRRSFLRGLATLPLIGGAVELIGSPVRADVQVSRDLQRRYIAWLFNEHAAALYEYENPGIHHIEHYAWSYYRPRTPLWWMPDGNEDIDRSVWLSLPSSRAAVILSAVGCDWRQWGVDYGNFAKRSFAPRSN